MVTVTEMSKSISVPSRARPRHSPTLFPGLDPFDDANNNGINNLLEYALGSKPPILPSISANGGQLQLAVTQRNQPFRCRGDFGALD